MNSDYNRLYNLIINTRSMVTKMDERLIALETRPCSPDSSASPAAAPGTSPTSPLPSAGSADGGAAVRGESVESDSPSRGGASPSSPSSAPCSSTGSTPDPTAAIRADPKRPKWLTDVCLPLPSGVERVYPGWAVGEVCGLAAYPGRHWTCLSNPGVWEQDEANCEQDRRGPDAEVYHVPQPATADKPSPLDQLAAEAQAEGEDAKPPTPRRTAREVAEGIALAYGLSLEHHAPLVRSIAAAIERDREGR